MPQPLYPCLLTYGPAFLLLYILQYNVAVPEMTVTGSSCLHKAMLAEGGGGGGGG